MIKFSSVKIGASQQLWVGATPLEPQLVCFFVSGLPCAHIIQNHFVMAWMSRKLIIKKEKANNLVHGIGGSGRGVSRMQCQVPFYPALSLMIQKRGGNKQSDSVCRRAQLGVVKEARTLKTMNVGMKTKLGPVGRKWPYSPRKQIKPHHSRDVCIRRQWGIGSSSGKERPWKQSEGGACLEIWYTDPCHKAMTLCSYR